MISEKLLREVLGKLVKSVRDVKDNTLEYVTESYGFGDGCLCSINV